MSLHPNARDLTGLRFGRLTVKRLHPARYRGALQWECECDCGKQTIGMSRTLLNGGKRSCGCLLSDAKTHDITGRRFGRLVVLSRDTSTRGKGGSRWACRCDCGNEVVVHGGNLRNGNTISCGCYALEARTTHGYTSRKQHPGKARVYRIWNGMRQRCSNPRHSAYRTYGARGVAVCKRWDESFENFLADMGDPPTDKHSIDRINPDGNYEPGNCRWATSAEQADNKRTAAEMAIARLTPEDLMVLLASRLGVSRDSLPTYPSDLARRTT